MKKLLKGFLFIMLIGIISLNASSMDTLDLSSINQINYPSNKYYKTVHQKNQVVLHHTVSGAGISGDVSHWIKNQYRIGTCVIVDREGTINQLFSSQYWAYHLGLKRKHFQDLGLKYQDLNKTSIGIELDNWGGLVQRNGIWYASPNNFGTGNLKTKSGGILKVIVPSDSVQLYSEAYRGYYGFEKYTNEQIDSTMKLLKYWHDRYNIPLNYNENMWDVNKYAMSGASGVWTHTSFRTDKSDCHPQPELIQALKNLV